jgi:hypothetical protein
MAEPSRRARQYMAAVVGLVHTIQVNRAMVMPEPPFRNQAETRWDRPVMHLYTTNCTTVLCIDLAFEPLRRFFPGRRTNSLFKLMTSRYNR